MPSPCRLLRQISASRLRLESFSLLPFVFYLDRYSLYMDNRISHRKDGLTADAEPLSTKKELARRLNISERWIEYRMADGLPHYRMGKAVRFQHAAVLAWIAGAQEMVR